MKAILMLVFAAALATAAGAEPLVVVDGETRSVVRVSYDDLNLGSARGRARLHDRVAAALRTMCKDGNVDPLKVELAERRCYAESIRAAGDQIERLLKSRSIDFATGPEAIGIVSR